MIYISNIILYTFKNVKKTWTYYPKVCKDNYHSVWDTYAKPLNFHNNIVTFIEKVKKVFTDTIILPQVRLLNECIHTHTYIYVYLCVDCIVYTYIILYTCIVFVRFQLWWLGARLILT